MYEQNNINPWGLRTQVFPNVRDPSNEFKLRWEANLEKCMEGMLMLMREQHGKELAEVKK